MFNPFHFLIHVILLSGFWQLFYLQSTQQRRGSPRGGGGAAAGGGGPGGGREGGGVDSSQGAPAPGINLTGQPYKLHKETNSSLECAAID